MECTLIDIAEFIVGNIIRDEENQKRKNREVYNEAFLNYIGVKTALANMVGKKSKVNFPTFEECFPESTNEKEENKIVYEKIDETNKSDFLKKQLQAYQEYFGYEK